MLDIPTQRLANQRISHTDLKTPAEVLAWMGPMQGQDYTGALWSVGLRLPHSHESAIEQALSDKTIVRTWIMRGTLHLVAAADIRWLLDLIGPKIVKGMVRRYRELELDAETLTRSADILAQALQDGQQMTRKELLALLEQNGIVTTGQRAPHLLQYASYLGLICHGLTRLNNPTYRLLDEAFPAGITARDEAAAELARRYFLSRGPTTLQNFVAWSSLLISEARAALEAITSEIVSDTINGETYWRPASAPTVPQDAPTLYLLPGFDEYLIGYRDRSDILDPTYADRICPGGNGIFYPTIVSDGQVVGTWKRTLKKGTVTITPQPFITLSEAERHAFAEAAQRYGAFLGLSVVLAEV